MTEWILLSFYDLSVPRRWVLALQLRSIRLLSVQFNLHSALMWPVSITRAFGGRCVCFTSESLLSADTVRQLQTDSVQQRPDGTRRPFRPRHCARGKATPSCRILTLYNCALHMHERMFMGAPMTLTGNRLSGCLHTRVWVCVFVLILLYMWDPDLRISFTMKSGKRLYPIIILWNVSVEI